MTHSLLLCAFVVFTHAATHRKIQADKEEDASIGKHRGGGGVCVGGAGVVVCVRASGSTIRMHIVCGKLVPTAGGFSSPVRGRRGERA